MFTVICGPLGLTLCSNSGGGYPPHIFFIIKLSRAWGFSPIKDPPLERLDNKGQWIFFFDSSPLIIIAVTIEPSPKSDAANHTK